MRSVNGLFFGWLKASIHEIIDANELDLCEFSCVMITFVDSVRDLRQLAKAQHIVREYPSCEFVGSALSVPGSVVSNVSHEHRLFTGFDELWCFDSVPILAKPEDVVITGPQDLATEGLNEGLESWMKQSECILGIGDGIGLNYITPHDTIAEHLAAIEPKWL